MSIDTLESTTAIEEPPTQPGWQLEVAEVIRAPDANWQPVSDYATAIGLDLADWNRLVGWVLTGRLPAVRWNGTVYVPRPSFRSPPPDYVRVQRYAADRGVSDSYVYALIKNGRLRPVWSRQVGRYRHHLVARWAEVGA